MMSSTQNQNEKDQAAISGSIRKSFRRKLATVIGRLENSDRTELVTFETGMTSPSKCVLFIVCQRLSEIKSAAEDRAEVHCPSLVMTFRILSEMSEIRLQNSENPSKILHMSFRADTGSH